MIALWALRVQMGLSTINDVPKHYLEGVKKILDEKGITY